MSEEKKWNDDEMLNIGSVGEDDFDKLKLNNGALKATQGDTGHAQTSTLTEIYAHVLDEDRKMNAQKFERAFYAKPDLREIKVEQSRTDDEVLNDLIAEIKSKPDLHNMLIKLLAD